MQRCVRQQIESYKRIQWQTILALLKNVCEKPALVWSFVVVFTKRIL
jgi:hypothetical protein